MKRYYHFFFSLKINHKIVVTRQNELSVIIHDNCYNSNVSVNLKRSHTGFECYCSDPFLKPHFKFHKNCDLCRMSDLYFSNILNFSNFSQIAIPSKTNFGLEMILPLSDLT